MLLNKTENEVSIKYNGMKLSVKPGAKLDVRDFDVANKNVKDVEKHIIIKHAGIFEQVATVDDAKIAAEYSEEIKSLKKQLAKLQADNEQLAAENETVRNKAHNAEQELKSVVSDKDKMAKKLEKSEKEKEDLEDEVKKLRENTRKGK